MFDFLIKSEFAILWRMMSGLIVAQLIYIAGCHFLGAEMQSPLAIEQRILIRSVFYFVAIVIFPLTTLTRYILIRLNQTMPIEKNALQRYQKTVIISQMLMEIVGLLGIVMFILGDDFNSVYIFSGMAILGFFLQRPKKAEYDSIVEALNAPH